MITIFIYNIFNFFHSRKPIRMGGTLRKDISFKKTKQHNIRKKRAEIESVATLYLLNATDKY